MEYKLTDLLTVTNYGKLIGKSRGWVYKLGIAGAIKIIEIDGIKFVVIKDG